MKRQRNPFPATADLEALEKIYGRQHVSRGRGWLVRFLKL